MTQFCLIYRNNKWLCLFFHLAAFTRHYALRLATAPEFFYCSYMCLFYVCSGLLKKYVCMYVCMHTKWTTLSKRTNGWSCIVVNGKSYGDNTQQKELADDRDSWQTLHTADANHEKARQTSEIRIRNIDVKERFVRFSFFFYVFKCSKIFLTFFIIRNVSNSKQYFNTQGDSDVILFLIYASWFSPPSCR